MIDAIVIGAGHNGLVCAGELARAGYAVLVVEAAESVGGMSCTREFAPGYQISGVAHLLQQMSPAIERRFALSEHGLTYAAKNLATIALHPEGETRQFTADTATGDCLSAQDQQAYADLQSQLLRHAKALANVSAIAPPTLVNGNTQDLLSLAKIGWQIRRLGRTDMRELLRIGAMNLFDLLNERLQDEALKGALSLDGVLGTHMGPRSPNTVLNYLSRLTGIAMGGIGPSIPAGGLGALTQALAKSVTGQGVTIRTGSEVTLIRCDGDRATGVILADGEQLDAKLIVSNADPKTTFAELVGLRHLNTGFARRVHNYRSRGNTAKLHLALSGLPVFNGLNTEQIGQRLVIADNMGYVERAFDHAKYGETSAEPVFEITLPSLHDPSLAPAGHHVLSANVQYAPVHLKSQSWAQHKDAFYDLLVRKLSQYAPDLPQLILHGELLSPADIAEQYRVSGGHWHHGELCLDQFMMMRPFPGAAQYHTPIAGLFLCGAGTHPGGGLMGVAGQNAARAIVRQDRKGRG